MHFGQILEVGVSDSQPYLQHELKVYYGLNYETLDSVARGLLIFNTLRQVVVSSIKLASHRCT